MRIKSSKVLASSMFVIGLMSCVEQVLAAPTVNFSASTQSKAESAGTATVTAKLSAASTLPVTVPFTLGGTATNLLDYTSSASPITIPVGSTSATSTVAITNDTLDEANETVIVTMGTPTNATKGTKTTHTITITDDDATPTVNFSAATQSKTENAGTATVTAQLSAVSGRAVTVPFTLGGTATKTTDYTSTASPISIPAGSSSGTAIITIVNDTSIETNETVTLTMGTPTNATKGTTSVHTLTITDDDALPVVNFTTATQSKAENGGTATVTAQLSAASSQAVTVPFTLGGTAGSADYTSSASPITIPAGSTSGSLTVNITDDTLDESDETVTVTMGTPTNATKGTTSVHTLTITDNDPAPTVNFTTATQSKAENAGTATVTAQLSAASSQAVTVPFTCGGTAVSPADYTCSASPINIPAGSTSGTMNISIIDDITEEADETVSVTMGTPTNATKGTTSVHTLTITANDSPTCTDGIQNGTETGVDCGGPCPACPTANLVANWNSDGDFTDPRMNISMNLKNNGTSSIDMTKVKMVYWFDFEESSRAESKPALANCIDCTNAAVNFIKETYPVTGADYRMEITFTSGTLAANTSSTTMTTKVIEDAWWADEDERNDYSYRSTNPTTLGPNDKMAVYYDGALVYGTPPACLDGVQNHDETGIDCGGSCRPCADDVLRSVVYPTDWTPGYQTTRPSDGAALFLQDYSYAGYKNSESAPPTGDYATVKTVNATNDGSADVTSAIQNKLNEAAATQGGAIVYLPAGLYRVDGTLTINNSKVVLRGAGPSQTKIFFTNASDTGIFVGNNSLSYTDNTNWRITNNGAIFDNFVDVQNATGIQAGDNIHIAWNITQAFMDEHNSSAWWPAFVDVGEQRSFFRRTVSRVEGNRIYFNVPLRYTVNASRDSAVVRKVTNYVTESGIEDLSINTALNTVDAAWNDGIDQETAIDMDGCKNCWIRNVDSFARADQAHGYHIRSHGIYVTNSFQVTVDNCHLERAQHLGSGGNGYLFQLQQTNEVLVKNSTGRYGRHNFAINWDFGASGNVFLRVESTGGRICDDLSELVNNTCGGGPVDFHHALEIANLFDSATINDGLETINRQDMSVGAGQTGTQNVIWNTSGTGHISSYNFGMGYVIGTAQGMNVYTDLNDYPVWPYEEVAAVGTAPEDFTEHLGFGSQLEPSSLFEDQLSRRLGGN